MTEKEKICSKCSKPITGKNFRVSDGEVVHKICPKDSQKQKQKKEPKVAGKSSKREENAKNLIEYLNSIGVDDTEKRKVMSRAYGIISKSLK